MNAVVGAQARMIRIGVERSEAGVVAEPREPGAIDLVIPGPTGQLGDLEVGDRVGHAAAGQRRVRQGEVGVARLHQRVQARAAIHDIRAGAARDPVVARSAGQHVGTAAAHEDVVAGAAAQDHAEPVEPARIEEIQPDRALELSPLDAVEQVQQHRAMGGHPRADAVAFTGQVVVHRADVRLVDAGLLADEGHDPRRRRARLRHPDVPVVEDPEHGQRALDVHGVGIPRDQVRLHAVVDQLEIAAGGGDRDRHDLAGALGQVEGCGGGGAGKDGARSGIEHRIRAGATVDRVETGGAGDRVVAIAAPEDVVAGTAIDGDGARERAGVDRVRAGAAEQAGQLDRAERRDLAPEGQPGVGEGDVRVALRHDGVGPEPAPDRVRAAAAEEGVVAVAASQGVVVAAAVQRVERPADDRRAGDHSASDVRGDPQILG